MVRLDRMVLAMSQVERGRQAQEVSLVASWEVRAVIRAPRGSLAQKVSPVQMVSLAPRAIGVRRHPRRNLPNPRRRSRPSRCLRWCPSR